MPKEQLPRTTVPAPAKASISTPVISCWPAEARSSERSRRHLVDVVDGAEADGARVEHVVDELAAVLARFALVGRDLVDAEILVDEGIAGDLAVAVDQAGDHLDQRRLAGAGRAVADEGEQEAAELDERVELPLEIIGHQHLGELDRLVFGDVVADDLFRLLEGHHQRLRLLAGRDVEAVEGEVVARRCGYARSSKWPMPSKRPLRASSPSIATRAKARARVIRSVSSLDAGKRLSRPATSDFSASCGGVEQEVGFGDVVGRLAVAVDQLQQIGGEAECGVSREQDDELSGSGSGVEHRGASAGGLGRDGRDRRGDGRCRHAEAQRRHAFRGRRRNRRCARRCVGRRRSARRVRRHDPQAAARAYAERGRVTAVRVPRT